MTRVTNQSQAHQVVYSKGGGAVMLTPGESRDIELSDGDLEYYGKLKGRAGRPSSLHISGVDGGDTDDVRKVRERVRAAVKQDGGGKPADATKPADAKPVEDDLKDKSKDKGKKGE